MIEDKYRSDLQRLLDAVQPDSFSADAFLANMRNGGSFALGAIQASLDGERAQTVRDAVDYFERCEAGREVRPEEHPGDPDQPRPGIAAWDSPAIKHLRGRLNTVLRDLELTPTPGARPAEAPSRAGPRILDLSDIQVSAPSRSPSPGAMLTPLRPPATLAAFNVDPLGAMLRGRTVYGDLLERMQHEADRERRNQSAMETMSRIHERAAEQWAYLREIRDELRAAAERERCEEEAPVDANGISALMTGKQAATLIGVGGQTLSRWRSDVPAWATGNITMFTHLMDREGRKYHRHNVLKLAKWFKAAQDDGGQKPVPCP